MTLVSWGKQFVFWVRVSSSSRRRPTYISRKGREKNECATPFESGEEGESNGMLFDILGRHQSGVHGQITKRCNKAQLEFRKPPPNY